MSSDATPLDPAVITALYVDCADELRAFLTGVLKDPEAAGEALQASFAKAVELGHTARQETLKSWLFRVALHEAFAVRRKRNRQSRLLERWAWWSGGPGPGGSQAAGQQDLIEQQELSERVRQQLESLPVELRQIVHLRIHENQTFASIADQLQIPLGTVVTRMRAALQRLGQGLKDAE